MLRVIKQILNLIVGHGMTQTGRSDLLIRQQEHRHPEAEYRHPEALPKDLMVIEYQRFNEMFRCTQHDEKTERQVAQ